MRKVKLLFGTLFLLVPALFFYTFYERFWRHDFNQLGRYYDGQSQTVYTDSGFVWIIPAVFFLLLALLIFARQWKK